MRIIDNLIMELDREAATTKKVLQRVPEGRLDYQPHAKSMTLGKLAWHIATIPAWIGSSLMTGYDFAAAPPPPAVPEKVADIVAAFESGVASAKDAMSKLDDATAMATWTLKKGDHEIMSMPRVAFVRTILLNHSYHHRGQLSVYLRLLDVALPSIYGPSADENPFA